MLQRKFRGLPLGQAFESGLLVYNSKRNKFIMGQATLQQNFGMNLSKHGRHVWKIPALATITAVARKTNVSCSS